MVEMRFRGASIKDLVSTLLISFRRLRFHYLCSTFPFKNLRINGLHFLVHTFLFLSYDLVIISWSFTAILERNRKKQKRKLKQDRFLLHLLRLLFKVEAIFHSLGLFSSYFSLFSVWDRELIFSFSEVENK